MSIQIQNPRVINQALNRLIKRVDIPWTEVRRVAYRQVRLGRRKIVRSIARETNVSQAQILRRVRLYPTRARRRKADDPTMYMKIASGRDATRVHVGREKGIRGIRGGVKTARNFYPGAFILGNKIRGEKTRVYRRVGDQIDPITDDESVIRGYEEQGRRVLRGALRTARRKIIEIRRRR